MKTMRITDIMADFLDSIRAYEHESGEAIHFDERESSEFVDIYFNSEGKINIEEKEPLFITEDGVEITDGMQSVITIDSDFNVDYTRYQWANKTHLIFGSKEGADRYIWKNKRVFSYNDLRSWDINGEIQEEALKVAKERGKE